MLTGGGSAIDGVIDADRTGVGLLDGHDLVIGGGGQDVEAGDNAVVTPVKAGAAWAQVPNANATFDLLARTRDDGPDARRPPAGSATTTSSATPATTSSTASRATTGSRAMPTTMRSWVTSA